MKGTSMIRTMKNSVFLFLALILLSACQKGEPPMIISFEPEFGSAETLITLKGANFDDMLALNFNNDVAADFNPSFGTDSALLFRVPLNAPLGENMVAIKTLDGETSFPFRVTLKPPKVAEFYPKSAASGGVVTILGENFFEPLEILFFDSIPGKVLFASEDSISVEVPENVEKGRIKVKANGGFSFTAEVFFTTKDILVSGTDPGSVWIGGAENHSNDLNVFENFGIQSDINNTFIDLDIHNNGAKDTHLIIVLGERGGSPNDFTETLHLDKDGWQNFRIPLNRFMDINGANIDPSKIRVVKLHLYNELGVTQKLEVNVDNLKFIQIN